MASFRFELTSPERVYCTEEVDMVVIPGRAGNIGVLANHAPLLSSLRPGLIEVWHGDAVTRVFFVEGGFVEVLPDGCVTLVEMALTPQEIDRDQVTKRLAGIRGRLAKEAPGSDGRMAVMEEEEIETVRLQVADYYAARDGYR